MRYFNSTVVPSAATSTYDLLTRGWRPLENENYLFPELASNPCATEAPLLLTGFATTSTTRTSVAVQWLTNLPAYWQIEVRNVTNGAIIQSPIEPTPKTRHSLTLT